MIKLISLILAYDLKPDGSGDPPTYPGLKYIYKIKLNQIQKNKLIFKWVQLFHLYSIYRISDAYWNNLFDFIWCIASYCWITSATILDTVCFFEDLNIPEKTVCSNFIDKEDLAHPAIGRQAWSIKLSLVNRG